MGARGDWRSIYEELKIRCLAKIKSWVFLNLWSHLYTCVYLYVFFALKNLIFSCTIYIFALSYNIPRKWYIYQMSYWDIISHPSDWQKVQTFDNIFCWQGWRKASNLICCWWGYKTQQLSQRGIWQYVTKLQWHLLFDLAVPLPSIHSDNIITNRRQRCTRSFKVLFLTAKTVDNETPIIRALAE